MAQKLTLEFNEWQSAENALLCLKSAQYESGGERLTWASELGTVIDEISIEENSITDQKLRLRDICIDWNTVSSLGSNNLNTIKYELIFSVDSSELSLEMVIATFVPSIHSASGADPQQQRWSSLSGTTKGKKIVLFPQVKNDSNNCGQCNQWFHGICVRWG